MKKTPSLLGLLFCFALLLGLNGCSNNTPTDDTTGDGSETISLDKETKRILQREYNIGDTIYFGQYPEDTYADGDRIRDIKWEVIGIDESNNRILIRSKRAIDGHEYHHEDVNISWEDCDLRKWLNTDFYESAFSDSEKLVIAETEFYNSKVIDKVFIPSYAEAKGGDYERYRARGTDYAYKHGVVFSPTYKRSAGSHQSNYYHYDDQQQPGGNNCCGWWLRPSFSDDSVVEFIDNWGEYQKIIIEGYEERMGYPLLNHIYGVRPALWLDLSIGK